MTTDGDGGERPTIYLCYEPAAGAYADRLMTWPLVNSDRAWYDARLDVPVSDATAAEVRVGLEGAMKQAAVVVCLLVQGTASSEWIAWELATARAVQPNMGLVGVRIHEYARVPLGLENKGAVFVPFRRDQVERAVRFVLEENPKEGDFTFSED